MATFFTTITLEVLSKRREKRLRGVFELDIEPLSIESARFTFVAENLHSNDGIVMINRDGRAFLSYMGKISAERMAMYQRAAMYRDDKGKIIVSHTLDEIMNYRTQEQILVLQNMGRYTIEEQAVLQSFAIAFLVYKGKLATNASAYMRVSPQPKVLRNRRVQVTVSTPECFRRAFRRACV